MLPAQLVTSMRLISFVHFNGLRTTSSITAKNFRAFADHAKPPIPSDRNTSTGNQPGSVTLRDRSNKDGNGGKSSTIDGSEQHALSEKEPFVLEKDAGWLSRILKGSPNADVQGGAETGTGGSGALHGAHSALGAKKIIYELQFHKILPDSVDKYLQSYGQLVDHVTHGNNKEFSMQLVGSWLVQTGGDQDQVVNLWKHSNGYGVMESDVQKLNPYRIDGDTDGGRLTRDYARFLRKRQSQYLLAFSFWGDPTTKVRQGLNLYEMRSYSLRPGTMVDWANHWARAIHIRKKDSAPVGGFFSQVGHMYKVYHVWSYIDFEDRRQSRDNAWRYPGWDECVQATVPLIKDMQSRLMYATPFSPLQ